MIRYQDSNLPPGVTERMLPGCSLRDEIYDRIYEDKIAPLQADLEDFIHTLDESELKQGLVSIYRKSFGKDSI